MGVYWGDFSSLIRSPLILALPTTSWPAKLQADFVAPVVELERYVSGCSFSLRGGPQDPVIHGDDPYKWPYKMKAPDRFSIKYVIITWF